MTGGKDRNPQGHRNEGHVGEQKTEKWTINSVFLMGLLNVTKATSVG